VFTFLANSNSNSLKANSNFAAKSLQSEPTEVEGSKVLWEGWIKYFHFKSAYPLMRPTDFFVNNAFYSQKVPRDELNSEDSHGIKNHITDKHSFYAKLTPNGLSILSEKDLHYGKTVEILELDFVKPINQEDPLSGPVKDLGTFNEGNCISVLQLLSNYAYKKDVKGVPIKFIPTTDNEVNGKKESWVICVSDLPNKEKLFTNFITYRLLRQKEQGIALSIRASAVGTQNQQTAKFERYSGPDAKPEIDGYLMLIQDWSVCSKKCGGGVSKQQWRCIPPKVGGRPCSGELIRAKKCNDKPCPGVSVKEKLLLVKLKKILTLNQSLNLNHSLIDLNKTFLV